MALTGRVTTIVYGTVEGSQPFQGANPFARQITWPNPQSMSVPTGGAAILPTTQGIKFGNYYVYSVICVPPSGLNQHGANYASGDSVATLVTNGS